MGFFNMRLYFQPVIMPPFYMLTSAWLLRETWTYFIFLRGLCGREITWKNGAFRIQTGGKAYRIQGMKVEDDEHCLWNYSQWDRLLRSAFKLGFMKMKFYHAEGGAPIYSASSQNKLQSNNNLINNSVFIEPWFHQ